MNNIKELRKSRGMTQLQLALEADISQGYLCRLELGKETNPNLKIVENIAAALGVTPGFLLRKGKENVETTTGD